MQRNGTHSTSAAVPADLATALVTAETTGTISAMLWPSIRELLLNTADPQLAAAVEPLRQLVQARQSVAQARQALMEGYDAVQRAGDNLTQLAEAASHVAALADDLSARAQQLALLQPQA